MLKKFILWRVKSAISNADYQSFNKWMSLLNKNNEHNNLSFFIKERDKSKADLSKSEQSHQLLIDEILTEVHELSKKVYEKSNIKKSPEYKNSFWMKLRYGFKDNIDENQLKINNHMIFLKQAFDQYNKERIIGPSNNNQEINRTWFQSIINWIAHNIFKIEITEFKQENKNKIFDEDRLAYMKLLAVKDESILIDHFKAKKEEIEGQIKDLPLLEKLVVRRGVSLALNKNDLEKKALNKAVERIKTQAKITKKNLRSLSPSQLSDKIFSVKPPVVFPKNFFKKTKTLQHTNNRVPNYLQTWVKTDLAEQHVLNQSQQVEQTENTNNVQSQVDQMMQNAMNMQTNMQMQKQQKKQVQGVDKSDVLTNENAIKFLKQKNVLTKSEGALWGPPIIWGEKYNVNYSQESKLKAFESFVRKKIEERDGDRDILFSKDFLDFIINDISALIHNYILEGLPLGVFFKEDNDNIIICYSQKLAIEQQKNDDNFENSKIQQSKFNFRAILNVNRLEIENFDFTANNIIKFIEEERKSIDPFWRGAEYLNLILLDDAAKKFFKDKQTITEFTDKFKTGNYIICLSQDKETISLLDRREYDLFYYDSFSKKDFNALKYFKENFDFDIPEELEPVLSSSDYNEKKILQIAYKNPDNFQYLLKFLKDIDIVSSNGTERLTNLNSAIKSLILYNTDIFFKDDIKGSLDYLKTLSNNQSDLFRVIIDNLYKEPSKASENQYNYVFDTIQQYNVHLQPFTRSIKHITNYFENNNLEIPLKEIEKYQQDLYKTRNIYPSMLRTIQTLETLIGVLNESNNKESIIKAIQEGDLSLINIESYSKMQQLGYSFIDNNLFLPLKLMEYQDLIFTSLLNNKDVVYSQANDNEKIRDSYNIAFQDFEKIRYNNVLLIERDYWGLVGNKFELKGGFHQVRAEKLANIYKVLFLRVMSSNNIFKNSEEALKVWNDVLEKHNNILTEESWKEIIKKAKKKVIEQYSKTLISADVETEVSVNNPTPKYNIKEILEKIFSSNDYDMADNKRTTEIYQYLFIREMLSKKIYKNDDKALAIWKQVLDKYNNILTKEASQEIIEEVEKKIRKNDSKKKLREKYELSTASNRDVETEVSVNKQTSQQLSTAPDVDIKTKSALNKIIPEYDTKSHLEQIFNLSEDKLNAIYGVDRQKFVEYKNKVTEQIEIINDFTYEIMLGTNGKFLNVIKQYISSEFDGSGHGTSPLDQIKKHILNKDDPNHIKQAKLMALLRVVSILGNEAKKGTSQYINNYDIRLEQVVSVLGIAEGNKVIQIDTGEGKTLITQLAATINALEGKKVDVITHAKSYVERDCDANMFWLGKIFNLNIAHRYMLGADAKKADIYYTDMPQAVADSLVDQVTSEEDKKNNKLLGRKADVAHVDETDNPTLGMESSTTAQLTGIPKEISDDRKVDFKTFLMDLNIYLRETVVNDKEFQDKDKYNQLNAIKEKFKEYQYTQNFSDQDWEMWISAVVTAIQFKDKEDYIVAENKDETYSVHIMHQKTSGREDKNSQWSNGVHQAVSAWEQHRYKDIDITINESAKVIAETDITNYMTKYKQVTGITGSVGEKKAIDTMHKVLGTSELSALPRAKRLDARDKIITFDDVVESNKEWVLEQIAILKNIKLSNINLDNLEDLITFDEKNQILEEYVMRFGPTTRQHKQGQVTSYDDLAEREYTFPQKNIKANGDNELKLTNVYNIVNQV